MSVRVQENSGFNASLTLPNIKAPKNGYCYVYVSNESDEHVYFDNLRVGHTRGRIIEENHYYAYGLKIAAISSQKLGNVAEGQLANEYLYNDKELLNDADLGWYDYGFRNYDPQIGRFPQLDPLTDDYPYLTPYQYASNDPITNIDLDGLEGVPAGGGFSYIYNPTSFTDFIAKPASLASTGGTAAKTAGSTLNLIKSAAVGSMNVASSTCQGCEARENLIKAKMTVVDNQPVFRQAHSFEYWHQPDKSDRVKGDPYIRELRQDNIRRQSEKLGDGVPIIGPGVQMVRRAGSGNYGGASISFLKFGVDVLLSAAPYLRGSTAAAETGTQSLVQENRAAGNLFRDELAEALRAEGRTVNTEVYKWTPMGKRYIDIDVWHNGVNLGGIETKVGGSRYLPLQRLKDAWLYATDYPVNLVRKPANW